MIFSRIAPTPSGYVHLGNMWSFAFTALLSDRTKLRWDDLDQPRFRQTCLDNAQSQLEWLKILPSGPPLYQSQTTHDYDAALQQLREEGHLFACRCGRKDYDGCEGYRGTCRELDLDFDQPEVSWRVRTDNSISTDMMDFIVKRRDGQVAYQIASVVDDEREAFNLIVRGEDLKGSSQAQLYLAKLLKYDVFPSARLIHHPMLLGEDGDRLSKSKGSPSFGSLKDQFQTPGAFWQWFQERWSEMPKDFLLQREQERIDQSLSDRLS